MTKKMYIFLCLTWPQTEAFRILIPYPMRFLVRMLVSDVPDQLPARSEVGVTVFTSEDQRDIYI